MGLNSHHYFINLFWVFRSGYFYSTISWLILDSIYRHGKSYSITRIGEQFIIKIIMSMFSFLYSFMKAIMVVTKILNDKDMEDSIARAVPEIKVVRVIQESGDFSKDMKLRE